MTMNAGAVAIDVNGNVSGAGLAREIFDDYLPKLGTLPSGPTGAAGKKQLADLCNSFASKTIAHIVANAAVTVTIAAGDAGLQRAPSPNTAGADTQGPSTQKQLVTKATVA